MRRALRRLLAQASDRGASAVEYGILVAAIAAVLVGVVFAIGVQVSNGMHDVCSEIEAHNAETIQDSADC